MAIENLDSKEELWRWIVEQAEGEGLPMSAISGLQEAIIPGKFNALTLENGWANYGSGNRTAGYMTVPGNGIAVYGLIAGGTSGTAFATLPPGARPQENIQAPLNNGVDSGAIAILSTGSLIAFLAATATNVGFAVTFYPSVT